MTFLTKLKEIKQAGKVKIRIYEDTIGEQKDSREDKKEREEAKKRILEENPHISKDVLEFMLSLPVERKIPKVTELKKLYMQQQIARRNGKTTIEEK